MTRVELLRTVRGWVLPALVTAALFVAVLAVQRARDGWPFSEGHPGPTGTTQPSPPPAAEAGVHPRAPVMVDERQLAALGVRLEQPRREALTRPVRAVATVVPDETRLAHVHTRVSGWLERLYVSTTGQQVRAGEPLAGIFSQELVASQAEYLSSRRLGGAITASARTRLETLGMTKAEIRALDARGAPRRLVPVLAPRAGVVLRRNVTAGTAVDPSTELFTLADLSRVWAVAELSEDEIPGVAVGTPARLTFPGAGTPPLEARVAFVAPTLAERTRTLRVRFELDNRDGKLRPGLYGTAELQLAPREALTVPRDAVVDSGLHQHVFVRTGPGMLEPRVVQLGARLPERVEVRGGLAPTDAVVASGVFLIDSESRLRASGGGGGHEGMSMPGMEEEGAPDAGAAAPHEGHTAVGGSGGASEEGGR